MIVFSTLSLFKCLALNVTSVIVVSGKDSVGKINLIINPSAQFVLE